MRLRHYSYNTEKTYREWIRRFIFYTGLFSPSEVETKHVKRFLTYLALERKVSPSTQNQAFNALLFLYREVLNTEFGDFRNTLRAKQNKRVPVVLTKKVKRIHEKDKAIGHGAVFLPEALERIYRNANREWAWQYVFPADNLSVDPGSGLVRRHHIGRQTLQRAMGVAVKKANIGKEGEGRMSMRTRYI